MKPLIGAAPVPTMSRLEADEARDFREWLRGAGLLFDEAPRRQASHRRGNGVAAGVPDFVIQTPRGASCCIELKRCDDDVTVSRRQIARYLTAKKRGWLHAIAFGAEDAIRYVRLWIKQ